MLLSYILITLGLMFLMICWMDYDHRNNPNSKEASVLWWRMAQCAVVGTLITLVIHGR